MDLTRWSPLNDLEELAERSQRLFGTRLPWHGRLGILDRDIEWKPAADIIEREQEYLIEAELPGVMREDIDVQLEDGVVTITGERRLEEKKEADRSHRVERFYGKFSRSFRMPEDVDAAAIAAEFHDGVLGLHLPKTKRATPAAVKIAIR